MPDILIRYARCDFQFVLTVQDFAMSEMQKPSGSSMGSISILITTHVHLMLYETPHTGAPTFTTRPLPESSMLERMGSDHFAVMKIMNAHATPIAPLHEQPHVQELVRSIVELPSAKFPPVESLVRPGMSVMDILAHLHPEALPAYQRQREFVNAGIGAVQAPQRSPLLKRTWEIPSDVRTSSEPPRLPRRAGADTRPVPPPAGLASPPLSPRGTRTSSLRTLVSRGAAPDTAASSHWTSSHAIRQRVAPLAFERSSSAPARFERIRQPRSAPAARTRSVDTVLQRASSGGMPKEAQPATGPHATRLNASAAKLTAQFVQTMRTQLSGAVQTLQRDRKLPPATVKQQLELILEINTKIGMWSGRRLRDVHDALAITSRRATTQLAQGSMPCNVIESFAEDLKRVDIRSAVTRTMAQDLRSMSRLPAAGLQEHPAGVPH